MEKERIQKYLAMHPEKRHRRFIPEIVQELTGVEPDKQIAVKVAIRRLQEEIPNDAKGRMLEEQWLDSRGMASQGQLVRSVMVRDGVAYQIRESK